MWFVKRGGTVNIAAPRRPIEVGDYWRMKTIHNLAITHDGRLAVYFVEEANQAQDCYRRSLYVTDLATGKTGSLTDPGNQARGLSLAPDGTRVAWVADEDALSHVCVASLRDVLACADSSDQKADIIYLFLQTGLGRSVHWYPDSQALLVDRVCLDQPEDGICVYTSPQIKMDGVGLLTPMTTEIWRVSLDGGSHQRVLRHSGPIHSSALSPDGHLLAFTTEHRPDQVFRQDLLVMDLERNTTETIYRGMGMTMLPAFSPDSQQVVFLASRGDVTSDATVAVWQIPASGGTAHDLAPQFDRPAMAMATSDLRSSTNVSGPVFAAAGHAVRFLASDHGASRLYEVSLTTGALRIVTPEHRRAVSNFAQAGDDSLVYLASDSVCPDEVFWMDAAEEDHEVTQLNRPLRESWIIRAVSPFSCTAKDGWTVEGFLQLPPDHDGQAQYPLVLLIHGGPRGAVGYGFSMAVQTLAAKGVAVLYVNPRGSDTYGREFANAALNDWGREDYEDLMAAVDAAIDRGGIDPARLGVTGYSYGGYMTTWVIGHTNRFKAAAAGGTVTNLVSFHGTSDIGWYWGPRQHGTTVWEDMPRLWAMSPLAYVQHVQTMTLLYHAENDNRCPIGQTEEFFSALAARGQDAVFVRYPESTHVGLLLGPKPSHRVDVMRRLTGWFSEKL